MSGVLPMLTALVASAVAAATPHGHHWRRALASWYEDAGATACDAHYRLGFASLTLPCGARVLFRHGGREVRARVQDRGPYVAGRLFDLNPGLKAALACTDLCHVEYAKP